MTVFVCSLFLPKTVHFGLPGSTRPVQEKRATTALEEIPRIATAVADVAPPSLFTPLPDITPPHTPYNEPRSPGLFSNEDGFRIQAPHDELGTPSGLGSRGWGIRLDQPMSRASTPPPASITENSRTLQKAKELGRMGVRQPRSLFRSDSHDKVFASANWKVVAADQGNGGLRHAVEAAAREGKLEDYQWIGTLGMPTDAIEGSTNKQEIEDHLATEHDMLTVFCTDKDFDGLYSHFCKQILWPVFHYQIPDNPKSKAYEDHSWQFYVNVNQAFADKVVKNWKRGDVVWVHDYHLLLVPGMVRQKLPDAKIGFFLHVPFPSSEVFRCLAVRKQLLEGMLGANLIGFQIPEYARHFLQTCSRLVNVEATPEGIQLEDRFVDVISLAIGIDPVNLLKSRADPEVGKWLNTMQGLYKDKKLIVARDKLDHVRGVRQKLLAYELFLNKNPEWRGKTVLIQVALSTGEKNELDAAVSDIVTRVNSAWANLAYQPVVYLKQDIDYAQYLALLSIADALMITSQREGMNLTSHEYLYCQGDKGAGKKHGSLILSEFAGTSSLFGPDQLMVNPWDYRQCADAIKTALEMDDAEKEKRWDRLYGCISRYTGGQWFSEFLTKLDHVYEEQHQRDQTSVPRLSVPAVIKKYREAERRLFLLDLEGTLVSWGPVNRIIPSSPQRTLDVLNDLLLDERNVVYVMSGRRPEELDRLFRRVPQLGLVAENGCFIRYVGQDDWVEMADLEQVKAWKSSVKPIMRYYLDRTSGAELEERRCSLIFHFEDCDDKDLAARQASDCASHVNDACEAQRVHAIPGEGSISVEPIDLTKQSAAERVYEEISGRHGAPDFLMAVGDGRDDEKVFKWANKLSREGKVKEVVTASLGSHSTDATATVTQGVSGVLTCLSRLASSG